MAMKVGCCIGMAHYGEVAAAGYQSIALPGVELAGMDDAAFQKTRETLKHGPLELHSVNSFCPPDLRLTGADFSAQRLEDYARRLFARAAELGVSYVGIGGPVSRSTRPGEDPVRASEELKNALALLCRLGGEYGLTILLEAVCSLECNLVVYTHEAAEMVRALGLPNLGLVYDIYHAHMMGEDPAYVLSVAELIRVVHIAQDQNGRRIYLREAFLEAYRPYIQALHRAGYSGEINMESFVGELPEELPRSREILNRLIAEAQESAFLGGK